MADIYDALRSWRAYKKGFSHERAIGIMLRGDERIDPEAHFDPVLLDAFARHHQDFEGVYAERSDEI